MNKFQRIALAEKDLSVQELSKILNRTPQHVSNVLGGRFKCESLREKISQILEKPKNYLWPEQDQ